MQKILPFNADNFYAVCDALAKKEPAIKNILRQYGYPPLWTRKPDFETLVHIILEQQVSLASARAALNKLKEKTGKPTPQKILSLTDAELKACYFSRQKTMYVRCLARAVMNKELSIKKLTSLPDEEVHAVLTRIKGIGNWTADVFLMMVLHRSNCFPTGDIALMNSVRYEMQLPPHTKKETILEIAERWKPHRTVAAFIFWHAYIKRKNIVY